MTPLLHRSATKEFKCRHVSFDQRKNNCSPPPRSQLKSQERSTSLLYSFVSPAECTLSLSHAAVYQSQPAAREAGRSGGAGGADPLSAALHAAQRAAQRAAAEAQRRANTERRAVAAAVAPLAAATPLADGVDLSQEQRGRPEWTT